MPTAVTFPASIVRAAFQWALALATITSTALSAQTPLRDHIDMARLRVASDSFVVMLQGSPRGWQKLTTSRDGSDWLLGDALAIDSLVTQASTIRFDAQLNERSLRQEGKMRGRDMKITLDWMDGRVCGSAMTPSSGPTGAITIDTTSSVGMIDDNAVAPLLSAVRYRDSLDISFPVLASGKGTIAMQRLRVMSSESITVPAGQFVTWKVELRAERSAVIVYVTKAAPYRVVKMSNGPAFEMLLAK